MEVIGTSSIGRKLKVLLKYWERNKEEVNLEVGGLGKGKRYCVEERK